MGMIGAIRHQITRRRLDRPLGFIHIPKAGGTGMLAHLDATLRPKSSVYWLDRSQFGAFTDFSSMDPGMAAGIIDRTPATPATADIIAGHIAPSTLRARSPGALPVTILRLPTARLLSHWLYWRGYDDERLRAFGAWGQHIALSRLDLAEFLSAPAIACQTDNLILRMLLWPHPLIPEADFIDPAHDEALLAEAHETLAGFAHVGIVENPALTANLDAWLSRTYGISVWSRLRAAIPDHAEPKLNTARKLARPLQTPLADQLAGPGGQRLAASSRLDLKLWQTTVARTLPGQSPDPLMITTFDRLISRYNQL
ncbi:hypothetical protein [Acidiphilium acidophilum]|uniref:hypothetical protein n=1 Tax=Acidiphilium acidophilum TaxID=76588 RepID=UPI002E8E61A9|nr:hypothetical protein [Acidiphilium acidophilum]